MQQVADVLGVSLNSLREWAKRSDIGEGSRPGLASEKGAELNRPRREVRIVREERKILNQAAALFAQAE